MLNGKRALVLLAVAGIAAAVHARPGGDIIFTDEVTDTVRLLSGGNVTTLWAFNDPTTRLADIIVGPDGEYYVANGPLPRENPSTASIYRFDNLLHAPVLSTLASSDPLQDPYGLAFNAASNHLIAVNNPPFLPVLPNHNDGLVAVNRANGSQIMSYNEPPKATGNPQYSAGNGIVADPFNANSYIVTCVNGGVFNEGQINDLEASTIWRMSFDTNTLQSTASLLVDLSSTNLGTPLTFLGGITSAGNDLFVADRRADAVYKIVLDANGDFSSIVQVLGGLNEPENLIYNPYTGKLVIDVRDELNNPMIVQCNLDGSGYEVLATGFHARGFEIVPAPATLGLLGLGGLIAARRRR